jgi:hypothetical protein
MKQHLCYLGKWRTYDTRGRNTDNFYNLRTIIKLNEKEDETLQTKKIRKKLTMSSPIHPLNTRAS